MEGRIGVAVSHGRLDIFPVQSPNKVFVRGLVNLFLLLLTSSASTCPQHSPKHVPTIISPSVCEKGCTNHKTLQTSYVDGPSVQSRNNHNSGERETGKRSLGKFGGEGRRKRTIAHQVHLGGLLADEKSKYKVNLELAKFSLMLPLWQIGQS